MAKYKGKSYTQCVRCNKMKSFKFSDKNHICKRCKRELKVLNQKLRKIVFY